MRFVVLGVLVLGDTFWFGFVVGCLFCWFWILVFEVCLGCFGRLGACVVWGGCFGLF